MLLTSIITLLVLSIAMQPISVWAEGGQARQRQDRPNVILIMTDDQNYGDLGFHGNDNIDTPVLDQLAQESARFERLMVCPLCWMTRAALLSGRYSLRNTDRTSMAGRKACRTRRRIGASRGDVCPPRTIAVGRAAEVMDAIRKSITSNNRRDLATVRVTRLVQMARIAPVNRCPWRIAFAFLAVCWVTMAGAAAEVPLDTVASRPGEDITFQNASVRVVLKDKTYLSPLFEGRLLPLRRTRSSWRPYPADVFAQLMACLSPGGGFLLWTDDGQGQVKAIGFDRRQSTAAFGVRHLPSFETGRQWKSPYHVRLSFCGETWRDAADIYRAWATAQSWSNTVLRDRTDVPELLLLPPLRLCGLIFNPSE